MHLDQEQIERFLHGEEDVRARQHAEVCEACRALVSAARRDEEEILHLLTSLDHHVPRVTAEAVMDRARRAQRVALPWAAGIVLALAAAGVAVAIPGSPLRGWLQTRSQEAPAARPESPVNMDPATGLAVAPGNSLVIEFRQPQQQGVARVRVLNADVVTVRSLNGSATFTSSSERLLVDNSVVGDFDIDIPNSAAHVEIVLGNRLMLLKRAAQITADVRADSNGVFVLDLTGR